MRLPVSIVSGIVEAIVMALPALYWSSHVGTFCLSKQTVQAWCPNRCSDPLHCLRTLRMDGMAYIHISLRTIPHAADR